MDTTWTHAKSKARARTKGKARGEHYPMRRGPLGWLSYHTGMFLTRFLSAITYEGQASLPNKRPYVLAANHQTFVDGMWICSGLPIEQQRHFSAIAGADLRHRYGLFGRIILRVGRAIPIERKGGSAIRGLLTAKRKVDEGYILLVHPEGTRTHNGKLGEFQNGAAFIAKKANVPLVPVFIHGGYELFSRHMKLPKPRDPVTGKRRTVHIVYGEPLDPKAYKTNDDLTRAIRLWMLAQEASDCPSSAPTSSPR